MDRNRHRLLGAAATTAALIMAGMAAPASGSTGATVEYTVLAARGTSTATATAAIERAGGHIVARNDAIGMFRVRGTEGVFADRAAASTALVGAARSRPIGHAPNRPARYSVEREAQDTAASTATAGGAATASTTASPTVTTTAGMDPLDSYLWGLRMVRSDLARQITPGTHKVAVGILDTGVDASNPDIAPNFNWALSRNFAPDMTDIDGPCEAAGCLDAVGTDDGGHGTHVAGTIGAAANGIGVSGVAPGVSLVEIKGGQDSGYFFLEPTVNALTYAGDAGLDVVNMSFYLDPWLYNCTANPADSPAAQAEQQVIIEAMTRALTYAHDHGVTLVGSLGNNHEDLGAPRTDTSSPDYPDGAAYPRPIDNATCLDLPIEGPYVIGVSALGPSARKADYSNYGTEQISVAAPGGWYRDGYGTPTYRTDGNEILSTYPLKVLQEEGLVDKHGRITRDGQGFVFKDCTATGECGYYTYLQGTSMASPHASGVAALIVSRYGLADQAHPGTYRLDPDRVEATLLRTAAEHACPTPRLQTYTLEGRSTEFNAYCDGDLQFNGFYGRGIVDAYAAVSG